MVAGSQGSAGRKGAVALGSLIGAIIDPVTRRRGFATADLIAAWPDIVGARFADCTSPDKIVWPREENGGPAVLVLKVDGPRAVYVQHEAGQILERINGFLGYGAVGRLRIVQAPTGRAKPAEKPRTPELSAAAEAAVGTSVAGIDEGGLKDALARLGRGVFSDRQR
jgi:hypothetical protein